MHTQRQQQGSGQQEGAAHLPKKIALRTSFSVTRNFRLDLVEDVRVEDGAGEVRVDLADEEVEDPVDKGGEKGFKEV